MIKLCASPLQGFTDFRFRNAFQKYFGGIDTYIAPYLRLNGKEEIKPAYEKDLLAENNESINLIPQVMTKNADEFLFVVKYIQTLDYKEINWNLGCPYPMVAKRGMGSGLLKDPAKIDEILHMVTEESDIHISVKMRLGYENPQEILQVLPVLEKYPLENIAIHPRIGKQLYKGEVDLKAFENCTSESSHTIFYNGDITTVQSFQKMRESFPGINHWMIGRGLIADPFLPEMIKANTSTYPENSFEIFSNFHDTLFTSYEKVLSGQKHILMKMYHFWEYFAYLFPSSPKGLKKIKKAQSIAVYFDCVKEIISMEAEATIHPDN